MWHLIQQVKIADEVIRQIQSIGGRFLKEDDEGAEGWYEVDQERAVEKTCQALREKDKAKTPTGDPFTDPNKKTTLAPFTKSRSKKKRKLDDSDDDDSDDDDDDDSDDGDSFDEQDTSEQKASQEAAKPPEKPKVPIDTSNIIQQIRLYDEHEMLKRLNQFKTVYGHAGVPPGWPRDVRLADWCSAQRQVYREIMAAKSSECAEHDDDNASPGGYRKPSDAEDDLIKELDDMEFVWNYEEWHWKDRYEQLMSVEHGDLEPATADFTRKALVRWLNHEREQVRLGDTVLTQEQMEDLKRAGICL